MNNMEQLFQQVPSINDIPIEGTPERTEQVNVQFRADLATYATRPFLDKYERHDLGDYFCTWGINRIIALFNFDRDGNYLPELYQAPKEYLQMLYPIDDLMQYEKQGTLIIDREQYSPELRKLSYYIYMVDAEMYDQYKADQHFNGPSAPTFMVDRHHDNGVRIFHDYYALARHLRKRRFITYCIGPRTAFYLRYFIYQMHVHVVDNNWAYGKKEPASLANETIESIKRHLAFNNVQKLDYKVHITIDKYQQFRVLMKSALFKTKLPDAEEYNSTTDILRYSKQSLNSINVYHCKKSKMSKYEPLGIKPWHNVIFYDKYALFFVWDTRTIDIALPIDQVEHSDFSIVNDNKMDLVCKVYANDYVRKVCEDIHTKLAIQMRD